ncbi:hypothetical protein [Peribacillus butanolivorans]|uniref:hypothetical protein n=1 Tax=Peribacillus butanolivorans TaxID=421767 RepID=UPI00366BD477
MKKLDQFEVRIILYLFHKQGKSTREIADRYVISMRQVQKIVKGESWTEVYDTLMQRWGSELFIEQQEEEEKLFLSIKIALDNRDFLALGEATEKMKSFKVERHKRITVFLDLKKRWELI